MKKTLVLCFIHGFKGDESTFGHNYRFTEDLRARVAEALPRVDVKVLVYPRFETRGDLGGCVSRFRSWLEEKVIDMEVAAATPSPTIDPSVRVVLVGHSMGGIVAAETVIGLASEQPIYSAEDGIQKADPADPAAAAPCFSALMFPYVQGVLAFDTPYLGISPGVVAHGAEDKYNAAAATISQLSGVGASLWGANKAAQGPPHQQPKQGAGALPAPKRDDDDQQQQQQQRGASPWQKWGKVAMYAGAAGAVAAGGAAAWLNRGEIGKGWSWATSHLEFVGCLARPEELKKRVAYMARLGEELDVGFATLYTRLGRAAPAKEVSMVGTVLGRDRTFCNVPHRIAAGRWEEAVNEKAAEETWAHMGMFEPAENPGYEKLTQDGAEIIAGWLQNDWYNSSSDDKLLLEEKGA